MEKSVSKPEDKNVLIKTDVDSLVKLVNEKKEISFSEAAEILKVPTVTVEAWGNYLEEEGVLGIKYKLTTPYLITSQTKTTKPKQALPQIKLPKKPKYPAAHLDDKPVEKKEEFDIPDILPELSKNMNVMLQKAYSYLEQGKFEEANKIYQLIKVRHEELPFHLQDVKREMDVKLTKLNKDMSLHIKNEHAKTSKEISKQIRFKLQKLNFVLLRRDIKHAEELYTDIETLYSALPNTYAIQKAKIQGSILDSYEKVKAHVLMSNTTYIIDQV